MIKFLDIEKFCKGLKPVTNTIIAGRNNQLTDDGLGSQFIFGAENSTDRKKTFSYIDLNCKVIHPAAYRVLTQLDRRIEKFISTEKLYSLDKDGNLSEDDENGMGGLENLYEIFPKIQFRAGTEKREDFITLLKQAYKDGVLFVTKIIVIPPDYRNMYQDESGNWVIDNLNDIYIEILRKAHQMKGVRRGSLYDLLNFNVQKSIMKHDDYIRGKIAKKSGLIRQQLLGKRVDLSGRGVITPGPDLTSDEVGIPLRSAVILFEPFMMRDLLYTNRVDRELLKKEVTQFTGLELSIDSLKLVLKAIKNDDDIPKSLYDIIWESAEVAMSGRVVLLKRDPALHALSIRAFYPKLTRGSTIRLSTLVISGFNADFDGDQMAIFHPLSDEAQTEAREKMMRSQGLDSSTAMTFGLNKEMYVGLYYLTKDVAGSGPSSTVTPEMLNTAVNPYTHVVFRGHRTTMGRAIFNNCFPSDFRFIDELANKTIVNKLIQEVSEKYDNDILKEVVNRLKNAGFKFAMLAAPSISLDDLDVPQEIEDLKKQLKGKSPEEVQKIVDKIEVLLKKHLKGTGLGDLADSGASKGWDQIMTMLGTKGIGKDPEGKLLPVIDRSLADGMTNEQYFIGSQSARAGIIDRVINTADTGYFARKLAYVLNSVEASKTVLDCKTPLTLSVSLNNYFMKSLTGRYIVKGGKVIPFNPKDFKSGDIIQLRSPIFCRSPQLCHYCYGKLLAKHRSPYVGIVAAQSIGEKGTQMIMRTFHMTKVTITRKDMLSDILSNNPIAGLTK
jgi:DNA-directed RNA polymerase subunit beta'